MAHWPRCREVRGGGGAAVMPQCVVTDGFINCAGQCTVRVNGVGTVHLALRGVVLLAR